MPADLFWVFREDVLPHQHHILVKEPLPKENERIAASIYERGVQRDLGVRLDALCVLGERTCCYVWLPEDHMDAKGALVVGSQCMIGVPTHWTYGESVRDALVWQAYQAFEPASDLRETIERLPRRNI